VLLSRDTENAMKPTAIDWSDCPLVEVVPGKVGGVPILIHSRVQADAIVENYEGGETVEDIADNFDLPEDHVRQVVAFAARQKTLQLQ